MRLTHLISAVLLISANIAFAQDPTPVPSPTTPPNQRSCEKLAAKIAKLDAQLEIAGWELEDVNGYKARGETYHAGEVQQARDRQAFYTAARDGESVEARKAEIERLLKRIEKNIAKREKDKAKFDRKNAKAGERLNAAIAKITQKKSALDSRYAAECASAG